MIQLPNSDHAQLQRHCQSSMAQIHGIGSTTGWLRRFAASHREVQETHMDNNVNERCEHQDHE